MTKYKRFTGKVFGGTATATGNDPQISQFGSALAGTFTGTTDPETIQSLPAWGQGWIGAVTPNTQFPALPEMTGAMKVFSYLICYLLQQGVAEWDSNTIYYKNNYCSLNGNIYVSLSDFNQNNNPTTDITNWKNFLADKLNLDASNLDSQGKSYICELNSPSTKKDELTLGPSGQTYIAPATGWFYFTNDASSGNPVMLLNLTAGIGGLCPTGYQGVSGAKVTIKAGRGDTVQIRYIAPSGSTSVLFFVYSTGEV